MTLEPSKLLAAIAEESTSSRSLLFLWLTGEPNDVQEYLNVADQLLAVGERNLAHLVIHRGLALFVEDEKLSLFALKLEMQRSVGVAA
jgi:hypothetical protein